MDKPGRHIRSFVLRQGRLTTGQQQALERLWPQYGINYSPQLLDLDQVFGRYAPRVLDIGTGNGESTVQMALSHPENDYIAVEVHKPGIGSLLRQIEEHGLENIRVCNHDIVEVLRWMIPENCLDEVYLFFPDPWPKKRHHKRRLVNSDFLSLLDPHMKRHARLFIATDWQDYADHITGVFSQSDTFINLAGESATAPRPHWRVLTRFEQRGQHREHSVNDFVYGVRQGSGRVS